jgi:ABC-type uncharacterized transport system auxiliary subunit
MRTRHSIALILLLPLLAACGALRTRPPEEMYRLAYPPPAPNGSGVPATLRVLPFGIAAAYDRLNFVYRDGPYDVGIDSYHRWIAGPSGMITDLLARDLSASDTFQAVLQAPSALAPNYELSGWVETFEERDDEGCMAHVRVRLLFVRVPDRGTRQVLFEESLTGDEACTRGDGASFAEAMSHAVQHLSEDLRTRVVAAALAPPSATP